MDLSAFLAADRIFLIINYIVLAGSFLYAFFRPKEQTGWLVVSSNVYMIVTFITVFMLFFARAGLEEICTIPLIFFWSALFLYILKNQVELLGSGWAVPFIFFVLAIAQEMLSVISAGDLETFGIIMWYFAGMLIIVFGSGFPGKLLDRSFPAISAKHLETMKERFGDEAPFKVKFKNGSAAEGDFNPGRCTMMGVIYALWMMLRHLLLP